MPKASTETKTKTAAKAANTKTAKPDKEEKTKRAPTAYNVFMKDKLAGFKAEHPDMNHKEAFKAVAALWKDAPENPNKGGESKPKKKAAEDKENATSKPKSRKASKKDKAEQSEEEDEASDD